MPPQLERARSAGEAKLVSKEVTLTADTLVTTLRALSTGGVLDFDVDRGAPPIDPQLLQGGTQDNGTWETPGNPVKWENTMTSGM